MAKIELKDYILKRVHHLSLEKEKMNRHDADSINQDEYKGRVSQINNLAANFGIKLKK